MKKSLLLPAGLLAVVATGLVACSPREQDLPPKPKVTAGAPPATAAPAFTPVVANTAAPTTAAPAATLPKMGPAPVWRLEDLAGKPVTADQFKGKVVVVDFWATWCAPCRAEIPGYIELQKKYADDGLVIVGISIDQAGPEVVKSFAEKIGINYPLVMADEKVAAAFGGVEVIPTTFLIDRKGQIRDRKEGAEETSEYEKKIASVLGEKA